MSTCEQCGHATYWHWWRQPDNPDQFTAGACLCGCCYHVPTTWTA